MCLCQAPAAEAIPFITPQVVVSEGVKNEARYTYITKFSAVPAENQQVTVKPVPAATVNKPAEKQNTPVSRSGVQEVRQVLATALSQLGKPYVYGGNGPNGYDCSGFTTYVFKQYGINLPRTADGQMTVGARVSKDQLAEGDLVFFGYYGGRDIQHVGIYLGDGTFIHSSSNRGVIITSLSQDYYITNYKGATRILR